MNKKKFYDEIMSKVTRKSRNLKYAGLEHQKILIKWHYDRYMLFNKIKGDYTTVGDVVNYEAKRYVKYITQNYSLIGMQSWHKLFEKVKARKHVTIVHSCEGVTFNNGLWNIKVRDDTIAGKYLVYADS